MILNAPDTLAQRNICISRGTKQAITQHGSLSNMKHVL